MKMDNVWSCATGASPEDLTALDAALSYPVDGAEWSLLHEAGIWDGRRHLFSVRTGRFGTGLVGLAAEVFHRRGSPFVVEDLRGPPPVRIGEDVPEYFVRPPTGCGWRSYQTQAADAALAAGRGVVVAPPRSGKTLICARVVAELGLPTLWVAPTRAIVEQTAAVLRGNFQDGAVGVVADGEQDLDRRFTVATAAGAVALPQAWLASRWALVIDEFHHAPAATWQQLSKACAGAYYRFGATGTHFRADGEDMLMHAVLGNVVARFAVEDLVHGGHLAPAAIFFVPVGGKVRAGNHQKAIRLGIVEHEERNAKVVAWAEYLRRSGLPVVVLVERIEHGVALAARISGSVFVSGADTSGIARFNAGEVDVLVGTSVLGEGVDLPRAAALVLARGGKSPVAVWQAIFRVLTAAGGKRAAVIVDFADRHHRTLLQWALERLRMYAQEPSFKIRVLEEADAYPSLSLLRGA